MLLAETVSIDGGTLAMILVVFLVLLAVWIGLMVYGFKLAVQAGQGSQQALVRWVIVAALVLLMGSMVLPVPLAVVGIQIYLYTRERRKAPPPVEEWRSGGGTS